MLVFDMMGGYGMAAGWMIFGFIFWIIIIASVVLLVKWLWEGGKTYRETPLDILKQRYARGEISKEEFEAKKRGLM
ncbi:MAG: SHOCT domain-containing protein [Candidatus Hydrothermarchaeaceae archaeon]